MAEDISVLVMKVVSDGISDGAAQLERLNKAAEAAEQSTKKLGTALAAQEAVNKNNNGTTQALLDILSQQNNAINRHNDLVSQEILNIRQLVKTSDELQKVIQKLTEGTRLLTSQRDNDSKSIKNNIESERQASIERQQAILQRKRDMEMLSMDTMKWVSLQEQAEKMNRKFSDSLSGNTGSFHSNAAAMRESMVLIHELSQGSYKRFGGSLLVLAGYMDVIPTLMEKIGATSKIAQFGILGLIGAIGVIAYEFVHVNSEIAQFNDHIALAGNVMGVSRNILEDNAEKISKATSYHISNVRGMLESMALQGIVTNENMEIASKAMLAYQRLSGESSEEVVKHFANIRNGVEKFALEHNKTGIAVDARTIEMIHTFEMLGDKTNATKVYFQEFGEAVQKQVDASNERLTALGKTTRDLGNWFKDLGHWFKEAFATTSTIPSEIQLIDKSLERAKRQLTAFGNAPSPMRDNTLKMIETLEIQKRDLQFQMQQETNKKIREANEEARTREGAAAMEELIKLEKRISDKQEKFAVTEAKIRSLGAITGLVNTKEGRNRIEHDIEDARQKWLKEHQQKGMDDRKQLRDIELDSINYFTNKKIKAYDFEITESERAANKLNADRHEELDKRQRIYNEEIAAYENLSRQKNAIMAKYGADTEGKSNVNLSANALKAQKDYEALQDKIQDIRNKSKADEEKVMALDAHDFDQEMKHIQTKDEATQTSLRKELESIQKKDAKINSLKSKEFEYEAQSNNEKLVGIAIDNAIIAAQMQQLELNGQITSDEYGLLQARLTSGEKTLKMHAEIGKALEEQIKLQKDLEQRERNTKAIDDALAAAHRFEKGMTDSFGNIGKSIGGITVAITEMIKSQDKAMNKFRKASEEDIQSGKARKDLNDEITTATITGFADMADAAKGFFDKKSAGYKAADAISKVLHTAELARNAISLASNIVTGASAMFAQGGFAGFAGVAAMAAVLAGLGAATMGGGGSSGPSAADVQKRQGTGSVFGDIGQQQGDGTTLYSEKSDSIRKSLEMVQNNTTVLIPLTQGMLSSLRNIEASITGLSNLVIRTTGLTTGASFGVPNTVSGPSDFIGKALNSVSSSLGTFGNITAGFVNVIAGLWGKTSRTITDAGIQFAGSVKDLQKGIGYQQYANVTTTSSSFFGLVKKTSNQVLVQGLSDELSKQFGLIFQNLEDVLKAAAPSLGKSTQQVVDSINNLVLAPQQISLKGLSGKDLEDAIYAVISKASDDIAKAVFPGFERFAKVGEGYSQTLIRVANDTQQVGEVFKLFGKTLDTTSPSAVDISEKLIELSGGLEKFVSNAKTFATDFLSESEQLAPVQKALNERLSSLGVSTNISQEQFKKLVISQDLTTASGQSMYTALMEISPAFKQITEATRKLTEARKDLLAELATSEGDPLAQQKRDREKALEEMAKLGPEFVTLKQKIFDAQDAMQQYNAKHSLELDILNAQGKTLIVTAANRISELEVLQKTNPELVEMKKQLYAIQDETQRANAKRQLEVQIAQVQGDTLYAMSLQRKNELDALQNTNPELVAMQKYLYDLQDAAASTSARKSIETEIATLQNKTFEYAVANRKEELNILQKTNPELVGLKEALYDLQDASEAFKKSMDVVEKSFKRLQDSVKIEKDNENKAYEQRKKDLTETQNLEKQALEDAHKLRLSQIEASTKGLEESTKAQIEAQKKANQILIDAAKSHVDDLTKILDNLKTSIEATQQYDLAEAHRKALETVRAASKTSDIASYVGLDNAIKELAKPTETLFSSLLEYQTSQAEANAALQNLNSAGQIQLSDAQKQLDALTALKDSIDINGQAQLDALGVNSQAQKDAEDARYEDEKKTLEARHQAEQDVLVSQHEANIARLDLIVSQAQIQIDALNGIDSSIIALSTAMSSFASATINATIAKASQAAASTAASAVMASTQTSSNIPTQQKQDYSSFVESLYGTLLNRKSDVGGFAYWTSQLSTGARSSSQVVNEFLQSAEYTAMHKAPSFDVGTNFVPSNMLANIHKGERIIPPADNAALMEKLDKADEKGEENNALIQKLNEVIQVVQTGDTANVQKVHELFRIIRDWDANGMPPTRT